MLNLLKNNDLEFSSNNLSGAGGGIPAAFQIFYNSRLLKASEFILNNLGVGSLIDEVDHIITGEGAYDHQSDFEKGAGVIIENLSSKVDKIFLVCGKIEQITISTLPKSVVPNELLKYFKNEQESINNYKEGLKKASAEILKEINF
jgi:glycerate kinase